MNLRFSFIFLKKKTFWVPFLFVITQIIIELMNDIFIIRVPPQFYNRTYPQFVWEGGVVSPLKEEFLFRIIGIGLFSMFFIDKHEVNLFCKLKEVVGNTIQIARWGIRFPYHLDIRYEEDLVFLILLFLTSFAFGIIHIWGYGVLKFFPTFLMGILLGWLFLRYGFTACISYHIIYNSILITGGFFFSEYEILITYGVIPLILLGFIIFYECIFPMNTKLLENIEECYENNRNISTETNYGN